jgi:hypothetical protein
MQKSHPFQPNGYYTNTIKFLVWLRAFTFHIYIPMVWMVAWMDCDHTYSSNIL